MPALLILFFFLLGLAFGSFLNVCISRVPSGESVLTPRSHCRRCGHPIRWFDNLPLLSWLLLRGRCRDCHASISWRYPAVELATGLWFLLLASRIPPQALGFFGSLPSLLFEPQLLLQLLGLAILGFLLLGLLVIDWQHGRLPDAFTLTGIALGLLLVCTEAIFLAPGESQIVLNSTHQLRLRSPGSFAAQGNVFLTGPESLIFGRLAAVVGAALVLLLVRWLYRVLRHREGLGLGDVKLLAMIAAFLGFAPALLTLFLGTLLATLYALVLIARRRATALTALPFGSFLAAAGLLSALFGQPLLDWYRSLLAL